MRLVGCVCGVTGTSSVLSDCLWKELVLDAGACSAYGNSVSSPWFGWLESLMVLCAFLTHHLV